MTQALHPWLSTPEAVRAAHRAVQIPLALMGARALHVGADELLSEAFAILAECALPPGPVGRPACASCGGEMASARRNAKFCSTKCRMAHAHHRRTAKAAAVPGGAGAHIGSMWSWPAKDRSKYAVREVGYLLCNWLRTRQYTVELPSSAHMMHDLRDCPQAAPEESPYEFITSYLERHGVSVTGDETFAELAEAARHLRGAA